MALVAFERSDNNAVIYFNPDHVVLINDNGGRARIVTVAPNGDSALAYTVTVSPAQAASMLNTA